ncbi:hypothetical protein [Enterobacter sp. RD4-1-1]|uniref:hypothetical protein n=1 Tax=Enterobacter sp. RD4-1-1 TaxID=2986135 RepID=UPI0021E70BF2|nr:hypothetical protein [Enterobacter sp. RD4-1-1]MCV3770317.1 hypothetical protein [Enterobacter sp. RD4-1-1]
MSYKQYPDLVVEAGKSVDVAQHYGLPTSSTLVLQCKYGKIAYINNNGENLSEGYVLVNSAVHTFETMPNKIFVCNPSPYPVSIAVAEVPTGQG